MNDIKETANPTDAYTRELLASLFTKPAGASSPTPDLQTEITQLYQKAVGGKRLSAIIDLFKRLNEIRQKEGITADAFDLSEEMLISLCDKHRETDEHGVTVGGRVNQALSIVERANERITTYLQSHAREAPSGVERWESIRANRKRIQAQLNIDDKTWETYQGQIKHCIDTPAMLADIVDLPASVIEEVARVTQTYRMRLTPYYASLIQSGQVNDPVLLQSVPTGEMVDNVGVEIPPVAADHSPARLIDQFYPRVVTIKVTNMCAMYCTHCLRIAHIGKKDRIYADAAYEEALDYIRANTHIRDVLITGGDAFVLPNKILAKILAALDGIEHIRMKRLGTRIPVTAPYRVDSELLDILAASNDSKPLRVVTQINTAQEITPVSRNAFKRISQSVSAVLNQAVLLKGVNDTRIKMWKLCETVQESYVRPYYIFNCSYRNPQFSHFRVPVEKGRDIVESMYGNISGDAIPRYIATAGGKIPLHRDNVIQRQANTVELRKPWSGEEVSYPDADPDIYQNERFAFKKD